jgi:hypothetical protein
VLLEQGNADHIPKIEFLKDLTWLDIFRNDLNKTKNITFIASLLGGLPVEYAVPFLEEYIFPKYSGFIQNFHWDRITDKQETPSIFVEDEISIFFAERKSNDSSQITSNLEIIELRLIQGFYNPNKPALIFDANGNKFPNGYYSHLYTQFSFCRKYGDFQSDVFDLFGEDGAFVNCISIVFAFLIFEMGKIFDHKVLFEKLFDKIATGVTSGYPFSSFLTDIKNAFIVYKTNPIYQSASSTFGERLIAYAQETDIGLQRINEFQKWKDVVFENCYNISKSDTSKQTSTALMQAFITKTPQNHPDLKLCFFKAAKIKDPKQCYEILFNSNQMSVNLFPKLRDLTEAQSNDDWGRPYNWTLYVEGDECEKDDPYHQVMKMYDAWSSNAKFVKFVEQILESYEPNVKPVKGDLPQTFTKESLIFDMIYGYRNFMIWKGCTQIAMFPDYLFASNNGDVITFDYYYSTVFKILFESVLVTSSILRKKSKYFFKMMNFHFKELFESVEEFANLASSYENLQSNYSFLEIVLNFAQLPNFPSCIFSNEK